MFNFNPLTKGILCVFLLFQCTFTTLFAQPELRTSRTNGMYQAGEQMNFIVNPIASGDVTYRIYYDKKTEPIAQGTKSVIINQDNFISFTLNEPGVVFCEVEQFNQRDRVVAVFSPYEIEQLEPEPDDFDAFWNARKSELAAVPINPQLSKILETEYATSYNISLGNIDGRRVYGYLSVPKGEGPFPGLLELPAFGDNAIAFSDIPAERAGVIYLKIVIHNAPANQQDPNAYAPDNPAVAAENYFRWAILSGIRSVDYITSRPEYDGQNMALTGVSQGGALSTMVAGLDDRVTNISIAHPSHAEHAGLAYEKASGWPFYLNSAVERNLDFEATLAATRYYDAINFAKRFNGKVMEFISYEDEISLASGIFAAFNNFSNEKILMHWLDNGHNPNPQEYWNGRYDFWRRHMPSTKNPPWPWPGTDTGYGIDAGDNMETNASSVTLTGMVELNNEVNPNWPVKWTKIDGPGTVSFSNENGYNTNATFSAEGTYRLQFSAIDEDKLENEQKYYTLIDYITVTVGDAPSGPTSIHVNCPGDMTIELPVGSSGTTVNWTLPTVTTDCEGNAGGFNLTKISGINNNTFQGPGSYTITYRVTNACGDADVCSFAIQIREEVIITPPSGEYCAAQGDQPWEFWIRRVQLEGINNTSIKEQYGNFLDQSANLNQGGNYSIQLTTGYSWASSNSYWKVWIDLNQNGIFSSNEAVVTKIQNGPEDGTPEATTTAFFTIPATTTTGNTRMRVAMSPNAYPNACGSFTMGEVEDYAIVIGGANTIPAVLTTGCLPDIMVTANPGMTNAFVGWNAPIGTTTCAIGEVEVVQIGGPNAGNLFNVGTFTVQYNLADDCNNIALCSFDVTVLPSDVTPPTNEDYCDAEGTIPWNDWIQKVRISSINNPSGKEGYADFTDKFGYLTAGEDKYIRVKPGNGGNSYEEFLTIYIDFNQDKDFTDPGEEVVRMSGVGEFGTAFDIPATALNGDTRMRIVMSRGSYEGPCGTFERGEVEDYTMKITGGISAPNIASTHSGSTIQNQAIAATKRLFPNPTTNGVYLEIAEMMEGEILTVQISATTGQSAKTIQLANRVGIQYLDLSDLAGGVYFISYEANGNRQTERVVLLKD